MPELTIRRLVPADGETVAYHRCAMFADMGEQTMESQQPMRVAFALWARDALADGRYIGWCAEDAGSIVAGVGMYILHWPPLNFYPHPHRRGHVMNVYTEQSHRRLGLARRLMDILVAYAREDGLKMLTLHASDEGRGLYESLGFSVGDHPEMMLDL